MVRSTAGKAASRAPRTTFRDQERILLVIIHTHMYVVCTYVCPLLPHTGHQCIHTHIRMYVHTCTYVYAVESNFWGPEIHGTRILMYMLHYTVQCA